MSIEPKLVEFKEEVKATNSNIKGAKYLERIKQDFHPRHYRQFRHIRTKCDGVCDLFSGYTLMIEEWLDFENITDIVKHRKLENPNDINRLYRLIWVFGASILAIIIRISSNDLRFWLTDTPYVEQAWNWAKEEELFALKEYFKEGKNVPYFLTLERNGGLTDFWEYVQTNPGPKFVRLSK